MTARQPRSMASRMPWSALPTRRRLRLRLHLLALSTFGVMGLVVVYAQHKGFSYHRIPFDMAALLCLATVAMIGVRQRRASSINAQTQ